MPVTIQTSTRTKSHGLRHRALFAHVWDLADDGVDYVVDEAAASGLNALCVAGTYHSGWFVQPGAVAHRSRMTEGSVCYFRPDAKLYGRLRPTPSVIGDGTNLLRVAADRLKQRGMRLVSWTVGAHNSRLVSAHPELSQQNVYGDRLPHALCPTNTDVADYLVAICRDIAVNQNVSDIQLEAFGWMSWSHGHHHERDLIGLTALEIELFSLCFCDACKRSAALAGIDVEAAWRAVRYVLDGVFREAPDRPAGHPLLMSVIEQACPAVAAFNAWRKSVVDGIVRRVRYESLAATQCRLLLQTPYDVALEDVADGFACGAYGLLPTETRSTCASAAAIVPDGWQGLLQCLVRLGMGVPSTRQQLGEIVAAVRSGGCDGIAFYNRSESPPKMLKWMGDVLRELQ